MRTTILAASVSALVLASGCYEQHLRLNVHEDGMGTIRIRERIAPRGEVDLARLSEKDREDRAHALLVDELASWQGCCAFSPATARVEKDEVVLDAKGYFESVTKLRREGLDRLTHRFDLREEPGTLVLEWRFARSAPMPDTLAQCRSIVASLSRTRIEATVSLPGTALAEEASSDASWVLFSGVELQTELRALEARLDAGEIDEAAIVAAVRSKLARTITARCRLGEAPEERRAFAEELARARQAYAGTELAREIEDARSARHDGADLR